MTSNEDQSTVNMKRKHLSSIANDIILRCAQSLDASVDSLVEEFVKQWEPELTGYSRKLIEFCCSRAVTVVCSKIEEKVSDGSFARFTFDMMLAWEKPSSSEDDEASRESIAKEKEEKLVSSKTTQEQDEIPLFYSDLMPLLVDNEPSVGEDAFVWLGTLVPLIVDVVNGRFTFETLTAPTGDRLHFPAYDKFLKEIHKCIKHLQKQGIPTGIQLVDDEFILHVDGTASTQRVVRHIGGTSWPGRLTLTNYALYFEASSVITYEDALKLDLSKDIEQSVKPVATGPWGAPIFDKAIIYESSELEAGVVLEFPEMTSSTRRDHWLALVKEVMLLHQFLSKFKVESPTEVWEMHARTILGIIRLHAARELFRISPPVPKNFLIFSLLDELPKGDYVLEELAESLKVTSGHPCSASSLLRNLNASRPLAKSVEEEIANENETMQPENLPSLQSAIEQVREETKVADFAKASTEGIKEEGIGESAQVLMALLNPLKEILPWFQEILTWERPARTLVATVTTIIVIYKEWVGKALSAFLLFAVANMMWARRMKIQDKQQKIIVHTGGSDRSTMENIVSAQQGLRYAHEVMRQTNIAILKVWSILISKAPKHSNAMMMAMTGCAIVLAVIPFKFILMSLVSYGFVMSSSLGKRFQSEQGNRRLKEWWDSIPIIPVEVLDEDSR